ncbi:hypothetical protein L6164_011000 [Bauhinia variegata]|uniref:Uncharacterized protein n=1 Tax=Bauhinia variegata TaxID=167791 RepID=A0ACB9P572_BAUVA|nr:hypothetical protein L6164_011000 [Bauhinia variegata]
MAGTPVPAHASASVSVPNPNIRMQQKKERSIFPTPDDTAMMKQVRATHAPDGREIVVNPIIQLIEGILIHAIAKPEEQAETLPLAQSDVLHTLAFTIHRISCELSCKCSEGEDVHATTVGLLNTLSTYPWHAKVVLTLAAFAVNFGKFWLVAQQSSTNTLANYVAILEQLPELVESSISLKPQFDALNLLVKNALDITKSIVEFMALPSHYISEDTPPMSVASAHIPIAAYWTMRSIVALSSQIISLIGLRNEYISSTRDSWELSSLAHKVNSMHEHLKNELATCYKYIDEKKYIQDYENLKTYLQIDYDDNQEILSILFGTATDPYPLVEANKAKVGVEALRDKHVLLLISDLDISQEEIIILDNLYTDAKLRPKLNYEMVWIPIVDRLTWNDMNQQKFGHLQSVMQWYSVDNPLSIDRSVIKYIKEDWNFSKRPIVVALDPQAKVCSTNALHMIWIWGNSAFPFTREKEETLWKAEIWSLKLVIDGIDPTVLDWVRAKFIFIYLSFSCQFYCILFLRMTFNKWNFLFPLYPDDKWQTHMPLRGENIEWLRTFANTAASVASAANITLEMVYVGKSNAKERMQRMISTFAKEKFSYYWSNATRIWFFWARLESMLYSKLQQNKSLENDEIMSEVMTVLTFDGSDRGWAIFWKGIDMAKANGTAALKVLNEFDNWKENTERDGFVPAFREYFEQLHTSHQCKQEKGDKKCIKYYENLKKYFQIIHVDNQKILSILFSVAANPNPLVDANKAKVAVEALRKKHVLLLISDLDISQEEIIVLENLYKDAKSKSVVHYDMVWIPVVGRLAWNDTNQEKFGHLQAMMPWYSVDNPLSIARSVIKYIREDWNFSKRPIIVALDPQARVNSINALHMIWIWGNLAFPFTPEKEEFLWKAEIWSLELIVDGIDPTILEWMTEGKHICLYGGEDIEWIRTFTNTAASVARDANITLEMVYVGKSNPKARTQRIISTLATEKLSYFLPNATSIWFFWTRLESMLYSKLQHNKTVENDEIMSEVITVLSFDGSDRGWAIFWKGIDMAKANGTAALKVLNEFDNWKADAERDGFVPALRDYLEQIYNPHHCKKEKDKKYIQDYETLKTYSQKGYVDNQKILSTMFSTSTDPHPLVDPNKARICSKTSYFNKRKKLSLHTPYSKKFQFLSNQVGVEALRNKHVLVLISDLDISQEEIIILDNLYKDAKLRSEVSYEMVWIPIVDRLAWNDTNQEKFGHLRAMMPWYCVDSPLRIARSVIKYIRENWNFSKRPIVVTLDPQAKVCSTNALHMIWIWGNLAFPFTPEKEEFLWKAEIWSLELIVDGIDPTILEWMTEGKHICLYGGEDIEWIRTFTNTVASVTRAANMKLELVYVGKNNAKERMQRMISIFDKEKFSYHWPNATSIWFFWTRLESMLYSKLQHNKTVENDEIMSEVITVLSFDGSDRGWAIFWKGIDMAKANGTAALKVLNEFDNWKANAERDGFVPAFREYLEPPHHCNRLILPGNIGGIPERVVCPECEHQKEQIHNPHHENDIQNPIVRKNNGGNISEIRGKVNNRNSQHHGQLNGSTLVDCDIINIIHPRDDNFYRVGMDTAGTSRRRRRRRSH